MIRKCPRALVRRFTLLRRSTSSSSSSSSGNVIDPLDLRSTFLTDGVRYCLLREDVLSQDANFNDYKMKKYLNAELANTLGNLLNRVTSLSINPERVYPSSSTASYSSPVTVDLIEQCKKLANRVTGAYDIYEFYHGIIAIMDVLRACNAYVQHEQPWLLAKSTRDIDQQRLQTLIYITLECLRLGGILLQPVVPTLSQRLLDILAVDPNERTVTDCSFRFETTERPLNLKKTDRISLYQRLPIVEKDFPEK